MRYLKILIGTIAALVIAYALGPHPATPKYDTAIPQVPDSARALMEYVKNNEALHKIKPDNDAEIVWADTLHHQMTEWAIVYLHGFSASKMEGDPVHRHIAKFFGCNLYLSRLSEHGIDTTDALVNMTADNLWESAKQAYAIGKKLGRKVILMGTSTGGTLALQLAATYPEIAGLILYSPNIAIKDPNAWLLNNPWGLQVARWVKGSKYNTIPADTTYAKYWNTQYRLESLSALEEMLETKMTDATFKQIRQPVLSLYYYKDEQHQDQVVEVKAIQKMMEKLSTSASQKTAMAMPNAGNHVLGSPILSKDVAGVEQVTLQFLEEVMHLQEAK